MVISNLVDMTSITPQKGLTTQCMAVNSLSDLQMSTPPFCYILFHFLLDEIPITFPPVGPLWDPAAFSRHYGGCLHTYIVA